MDRIDLLERAASTDEAAYDSDARATNSAAARKLYKAREPIYPKLVHGTYRKVKWALMAVTLAIYYLTPWIRWDRGPGAPSQAVLVDLAHERFYFFFIEIWPQEVYYITGLLILSAVALFLVTSLFGRLWCGYACPQTVWTDLFIWVENLLEGDRSARIRLAAQPWTAEKIAKRVSKHAIWIFIAIATGGAWVFYFADAPMLAQQFLHGQAPLVATLSVGVLAFTTYSLGGLMREQVCTYMCPWPRIQAAMTDNEALAVTYRRDRGEPRKPHKKGQPWGTTSNCIDCHQCVAACPMGIDIRDGTQLECINCALCIDACDEIMDKVGLPRGLIAYDTDANVERRIRGERSRFKFIRPRTILYTVVLILVGSVMLYGLWARFSIGIDALKDRNPEFVRHSDGAVLNGYSVKLLNHADRTRTFLLTVTGAKFSSIKVIGIPNTTLPISIPVEPDRVRAVRVLLTVAKDDLKPGGQEIEFHLTDPGTHETVESESVFVSGEN
ncbi:MAG: cytochrome c oxidase accessory protein CcoG [Rhizomicrobium sp.]